MYWEPCRRLAKGCDLEQAMSAAWGLVTGKPACGMGTCCKGRCWNALKTCAARRYTGFFVTPDKSTTVWREREPLHGQDLHSLLWGNPSTTNPVLQKSAMPSMWRVARITDYLFLFLLCLIKAAILLHHLLLGLLYCHQKEVCIVPPSPSSPSYAKQLRIQLFLKETFFLFLFFFLKHTYSSIKITLHGPYTAILWFSVQPQPLIRSS